MLMVFCLVLFFSYSFQHYDSMILKGNILFSDSNLTN